MQAQTKSQVVAAAAPDSTATLVRTIVALLATATLLFLFRPTVIPAQEKTASHTVVAGETLWLLATRYYGDGHKWPELAKLNGLGDASEKALAAGSVIKVPEQKSPDNRKASVPAVPAVQTTTSQPAPAPRPTTAIVTGSAAGALAAQTVGKTDAAPKASAKSALSTSARNVAVASAGSAATPAVSPAPKSPAKASATAASSARVETPVIEPPRAFSAPLAEPIAASASGIWSANVSEQRSARGDDQSTVFQSRIYDPVETDRAVRALLPVNKSRERAGEYSGAPYAVAATGLVGTGVVGRRAGSAGGSFRDVERLLLADEAEVTLPAGVNAVVGARFVSVQVGSLLKSGAQMVLPTGVLEVVKVEAGRSVVARVVRQSGMVAEGQHLVSLEGNGITNGASARAIPRAPTAPETEVTWVDTGLIPTLQSYVLLGSGEREGVKAGDEFALVTRQGLGPDAPELRVALVRVVRVTAFGSSAIVVRQDAPTIAVGGAARLVARVQ